MAITHRRLAAVAEPLLRPAGPTDRALLAGLLGALSPGSAQQRFLTGLASPPPARLLDALLPQPPAGGAVLALLAEEVVGHGVWVRLPGRPSAAEVALVVLDGHQRRGVGTRIARALTEDLAGHGVAEIEVFSSTDNRAVARMVARAAPDARRDLDGPTSTYTIAARARGAALPRTG